MVPNNDKNINAETSVIQALNELGLSTALNRFINSDRHADFAKDAGYRFLNNEHFN